ncbi:hypothetical protein ACQ86O_17340 [Serratia sp. L9]|uniref:hypothetical protein n=1 Tax=Serratia sp. L9 TaxID=3423946 RepID=UPI003D66C6B4
MEAEKKRRIRALMVKYRLASDLNYCKLASKLFFCNNNSPCKSQACVQCSSTERLENMYHFSRMVRYDDEYLVITIDMNSLVDDFSDIAPGIFSKCLDLLNDGGFEGVVFGTLTVENHLFPEAEHYTTLTISEQGYSMPQLRLFIQADPKLVLCIEHYFMKHDGISLEEYGLDIKNDILNEYRYESLEAATNFVFDKTWSEYQCYIGCDRTVAREYQNEINNDALAWYLLRQDEMNTSQVFLYSKVKSA